MKGHKAPFPRLGRAAALALAGTLSLGTPAAAQVARVTTTDAVRLLVAVFNRYDAADSAMGVAVADGLRDRLTVARATMFNVVDKRVMNGTLEGSGFAVDVPHDGQIWRQLARHINARVLVEGVVFPQGADSVRIIGRLTELVGTLPQSATYTVTVERRRANNGAGATLANRLADYYRSFEHTKVCVQRRQAQEYPRALEAARQALQRYPESSQAFLCMAQVLEAQRAPGDTVLRLLELAGGADSLNSIAQRQLARYYEERSDTVSLIRTIRHILLVDFNDNDLRIGLARLFFVRNMPDSALGVLDSSLSRNPNQVDLLDMRSRVLAASGRWADAASELVRVGELDSVRVDSAYVFRLVNYYQQAADTAGLLRWIRTAVERVPTDPSYPYQLALLLRSRSDTTGAVTAIRRYLELLPADGRGNLVYATYLLDLGQPDSAVVYAGRAAAADSVFRPTVAQIYFAVGARRLQAQNLAGAVELMQQGRDWAAPAYRPRIAYYLGLALWQQAVAADGEAVVAQQARNNPATCDAARRLADLLNLVEQNVTEGGRTDPEMANRLLTEGIPAYRSRAQAFQRACR